MAENVIKMRTIVDGKYPSDLRYEAIIVEEILLETMDQYIKHITRIKEQNSALHSYNPKNRLR